MADKEKMKNIGSMEFWLHDNREIGQAARIELTGANGAPIEHRDLTECSTEELQKMRAQAESCDSE